MKINLLILAAFLVSSACSAKVADFFIDRAKSDAWYVKASLYEQNGDLEEASRMLEVVLETVDDEYVYLKLANIYQRLKDKEMVKFTLERAVRKNPQSYELIGSLADFYRSDISTARQSFELYRKSYELSGNPRYAEGEAVAHAALKDYNSAIKIYDELIGKDEKSEYFVQRARYYEKLGLNTDALNDYVRAADIDGNFIAAAKLADHFVAEGEAEEAVKYLRMILKVSPDLIIAKFRLAELLRKLGKTGEAAGYYEMIVDKLNEDEKIYVLKQLAGIAYRDKELDTAEEYFARAYELDGDIQTAYSLALLAEAAENLAAAKQWYGKILEKRPDFVEASKRLAIIHLKEGDTDRALEALQKVEDIYQDVNFYRIKGQAYADRNDFAKAIEILNEAVKSNPAEVKLYIDLALAYDKNKDKKSAEEVIESGLKLFPEDPSLLNFLGYMYAEQGEKLKIAKEMIEKALEAKPDEPAYLDSMAWVLYQEGRYEEALPYQKRALKGAPTEEEIRDHMRAILKKLGIRKTLDEIIKED